MVGSELINADDTIINLFALLPKSFSGLIISAVAPPLLAALNTEDSGLCRPELVIVALLITPLGTILAVDLEVC